jgi:methyl coenzyme M reductase subunit C
VRNADWFIASFRARPAAVVGDVPFEFGGHFAHVAEHSSVCGFGEPDVVAVVVERVGGEMLGRELGRDRVDQVIAE